jgi:hypothetical protein
MAEAQDLNQIEYRHHPTRDLSPVASSMSPQSRSSWHAQIRAWVRHPHDDRLVESACYQVFPNGNAALAWRYLNERAAERADGSRGRPLVSRVLAGPASVLSPKVAVALSRNGPTADLIGPLPGEVPDGAEMPTVSGSAVAALADEMAAELDEAASWADGLQAIVAAALSNPSTPLAVSLRDSVIAKPLAQCVQCTLLWGLLRVAGPILGAVGRGWSFSTFELPLGDTDTAALPSIIFRQAQDTRGVPGVNWRKELKVRPLAADALSGAVPYADQVALAGWLVAEYRDRGGNGLAVFLADACGSERSLQGRLEQLQAKLAGEHSVVITSPGSTYVAVKTGRSARATQPGELSHPAPDPAVELPPVAEAAVPAAATKAGGEPGEPAGTGPEVPVSAEAPSDPATGPWSSPGALDEVQPECGPASGRIVGIDPGDWNREPRGGTGSHGEWHGPDGPQARKGSGRTARASYSFGPWREEEVAPRRDGRDAPDLLPSGRAADPEVPPSPSAGQDSRDQGDAPAYAEGQPPLSPGQPYTQPSQPPYQPFGRNVSVSSLLGQLELVVSDPARFRSYLEAIFRLRGIDDPDDRRRSWELISGKYWFSHVSKCEVLQQGDLAEIFSIVLIPELRRGGVREEAIANWALDVPAQMIAGLLAAVAEAADQRPVVHAILEPVLAVRWARDWSMEGLWDRKWLEAAAEADHRDDKNRLRDFVRFSRRRRP